VVSGDFFWIEHINNRVFMAVVDCTGHGVPGAFMSMIANTLLDHIVKFQHIFSPDKILQALNEKTQDALKQKDTENNNGMDAAFVCIDKSPENFILHFSGAKRPLYYVSAQTKKLEVIKGDKISIGGKHSFDKIFTKTSITLPYHSTFYLFSDGYADQCNEQRQSFGTLKLQELITEIASLPIAEQKTILETALDDFKQNAEQRDDILFVGVKLV
jgi:serine phosphatase RsbU (regulator of sigma subunit)